MRVSHKEIRRRINHQVDTMTDEQFFTSKEFSAYLMDLVEAASARYQRPMRVITKWDEEPSAEIAYTDNRNIFINTGNFLTRSFPGRKLKALSLIGLAAHELGHGLYSDFSILNAYINNLLGGRIYPNAPKVTEQANILALEEIKEALCSGEELQTKVIAKVASTFNNILEDAYIEAETCEAFPGSFRSGIVLNNIRYVENVPSLQVMVDQGYHPYSIITNLLIQYCRSGDINNLGEYTGEYLDSVVACIPFLDTAVCERSARKRLHGTNLLLVKQWKYVKAYIEKIREDQKNNPGTSVDELLGNSPVGNEEVVQVSASPQGKGKSAGQGRGKVSGVPGNGGAADEIQKVLEAERGRLDLTKTESFDDGSAGGVVQNHAYGGSGYENAAHDIARLLSRVAENSVYAELEEDLSEELQAEADSIRYGNAHRGITVRVNRMSIVDEALIQQYKSVAPPLLQISKRLQKSIADVVIDRRSGGKLTGLYNGRQLDNGHLYREDGRLFCNKRLPQEELAPLAVALLVDESGSMCSADRATTARAASIVLHDFCVAMDIPVAVYGHTDDDDTVIFAHADFDSYDNKDRFRLMDICARDCNRDGAALRFASERLLTRPEEQKLLILISDGQPNGSGGYCGTEAEADLRGIKREYTNKGITLFAAAIGDDKPNIRRIYGEDSFLDITDLTRLPIHLTRLLIQRLPTI